MQEAPNRRPGTGTPPRTQGRPPPPARQLSAGQPATAPASRHRCHVPQAPPRQSFTFGSRWKSVPRVLAIPRPRSAPPASPSWPCLHAPSSWQNRSPSRANNTSLPVTSRASTSASADSTFSRVEALALRQRPASPALPAPLHPKAPGSPCGWHPSRPVRGSADRAEKAGRHPTKEKALASRTHPRPQCRAPPAAFPAFDLSSSHRLRTSSSMARDRAPDRRHPRLGRPGLQLRKRHASPAGAAHTRRAPTDPSPRLPTRPPSPSIGPPPSGPPDQPHCFRECAVALERDLAPLVVPDPDRFVHLRKKNLAIADLAGPGRGHDRSYCLLDHSRPALRSQASPLAAGPPRIRARGRTPYVPSAFRARVLPGS